MKLPKKSYSSTTTSRRRIKITADGKYFDPNKYGLGGLIGSGLGAVGGAFLGDPMMGAKVGGMLGAQFDENGNPVDVKEPRTTGSGTLGSYKNGGSYKPYATGGYASRMDGGGHKLTGRKHATGGIKMSPEIEAEGGETMTKLNGSGYVFSDRLKVPGTGSTFAKRHEKLMSMNAGKEAVDDLAKTQERVSGRAERSLGNGGSYKGLLDKRPTRSFANGGKTTPYEKHMEHLKAARSAIGTNDKEALSKLSPRFDGSLYNTNDLSADLRKGQKLRQEAGLGMVEEAKMVWPHVGQRVRGAINSALGTHYANGGEVTVTANRANPRYKTINAAGFNNAINLPSKATQKAQIPQIPQTEEKEPRDLTGLMAIAPDLMNFAVGAFGKDTTPEPTKVQRTTLDRSSINYNINPQLKANAQSYRGLLSNLGSSAQERLAGLSMKGSQDASAYARKANVESQMLEQRNSRQAGLDANANAQQASMDERRVDDKMQADANLGITGNMSRAALSSMAQKLMALKMENKLEERDTKMIEALKKYYGDDPSLQSLFED